MQAQRTRHHALFRWWRGWYFAFCPDHTAAVFIFWCRCLGAGLDCARGGGVAIYGILLVSRKARARTCHHQARHEARTPAYCADASLFGGVFFLWLGVCDLFDFYCGMGARCRRNAAFDIHEMVDSRCGGYFRELYLMFRNFSDLMLYQIFVVNCGYYVIAFILYMQGVFGSK